MSLFRPRIGRQLVPDQGEVVIDEVRKHWAAVAIPWAEVIAGSLILLGASTLRPQIGWLVGLVGAVGCVHGAWRVLGEYRDIFVITNMRVFRVHGILDQQIATMPLQRILDISVYKPFLGRILGYGHFVFESAAQAQGLREIRYVGRPDARGLTIQRVIAEAGLRGMAARDPHGLLGSPSTQPPQPPQPPPPPSTPAQVAAEHRELAWLSAALRREHERLAQLRGEGSPQSATRSPDRTDTAPIDLPR